MIQVKIYISPGLERHLLFSPNIVTLGKSILAYSFDRLAKWIIKIGRQYWNLIWNVFKMLLKVFYCCANVGIGSDEGLEFNI